jgi:hypothetical protein
VSKKQTENKPLSSQRRPSSRAVGGIVFGIFILLGGVMFYFLTVRTYLRVQAARNWNETPCVVVSSEVRTHHSDDGDTYSVYIVYEYEVRGQTYRADRYDFMGGSSSGRASKRDIVRQHPPGRKTICYVNPDDPSDAVLVRGFVLNMLIGLLPLVFLLVGAGGLVCLIRGGLGPKTDELGRSLRVVEPLATGGPIVLRPKASPGAKVIGMMFIALFWNGIVSVFVWQAVRSWQTKNPEWVLTFMMIPFVLVGLGLIGGVGYFVLAMFNPRPQLTVSALEVPLGGSLALEWQLSGRTHIIERLRLYLEGREEATYQRGTSTYTDKEVFATVPIAEIANQYEMQSGRATVMVPPDTKHTFKAEHNKILWMLRVQGEIRHWPDVNEEFELTVLPHAKR